MNTLSSLHPPALLQPGTVYLVGAGPGDPSLITVRGLNTLRKADVVVYDRLVHAELLRAPRSQARRIYVGKAPGRHLMAQSEINQLLVAQAQAGRRVVRLKGGDPFVFGRGGEEGQALAAADVPFEVIPGVTSAISVPAFAGIPVTHRGVASAFTVVTGHACEAEGEEPDWAALARVGTLVLLMGLRRLPHIASRLVEGGCPPETPVAVIASGTTSAQTVVTGTLADIGDRAADVRSPATIVIGEVVRLREELAWLNPLSAPQAGFGGVPPEPQPVPLRYAASAIA